MSKRAHDVADPEEGPNGFPTPFGGIQVSVRLKGKKQVKRVIGRLVSGCGDHHRHNFAVEMDAHGGAVHIWVSGQAAQCIQEFTRKKSSKKGKAK